MDERGRSYGYVGPADLAVAVRRPGREGRAIRSVGDLDDWLSAQPVPQRWEPFTFVVDLVGVLRLAPRRSEHVACAGTGVDGGSARVLGAGEMTFGREHSRWVVTEVSNQSTGYCPDTGSWWAVAAAVDRAGVTRPGGFTYEVVFRRCPGCAENSIVREGEFVCVFCGGDLPEEWNVE
ncbi:hypothetical protein [Streptomyces sp. NBC_01508]|uniref:hypothetical protein n=1 Tax=Streptomyces sp. NBC_01508 TaxID=2903888 RepID=UPI0038673E92